MMHCFFPFFLLARPESTERSTCVDSKDPKAILMEFTTNSTGPGNLYQLAAIYFAVKAPLAASVDIGSKVPVGRKNGYGIICGASTNARRAAGGRQK